MGEKIRTIGVIVRNGARCRVHEVGERAMRTRAANSTDSNSTDNNSMHPQLLAKFTDMMVY